MPRIPRDSARVLALYLVAGTIWILVSDRVLQSAGLGEASLTRYQSLKGWLFVVVSGFVGFFLHRREILRRIRVHRSLIERRREFATLLANLPGMAYRCRNDLDWTMEFVSDGCHQLTGLRPADLTGSQKRYAELVHPEDRERVWVEVQRALTEDRPFRLTYRIRTATGEERWVSEIGCGVRRIGQHELVLEGFISDISEVKEKELQLRQAWDATLDGWSRALELRDHETENHTRRVTEWTLRLARRMGVAEEDLVDVRRGALLHDIGKMGIPDEILLKPGPLTPEERREVERHPEVALELLAPIPYLEAALDVPYCHHEKWDGSGYPRGLAGEDIPLAARIFAVVDVWDALTSDRPYRRAWSPARALDHLRQERGRHFDPRVVDVFLEMLGAAGELPAERRAAAN